MSTAVPTLVAPIREFGGMTRLGEVLDGDARAELSRVLAERLLAAARAAGLSILVVTANREVERWAVDRGAATIPDPGAGLDAAVSAAVASVDGPWIVAHADLPFVTASALASVAAGAIRSAVLVPSLDGGTTVVAGRGAFPFSFGPSSFHRHLAAAPHARIEASRDLSIDIDTPRHLRAVRDLERRSSLTI